MRSVSLANDTQSAMLREIFGVRHCPGRIVRRSFLAVIGALALALPLAACGRKGPLDPPPGGYALEQAAWQDAATTRKVRQRGPDGSQPEYDDDGRPIAPQGLRRKNFPPIG